MYVSETRRRHRDTSIIDIDQERDRFRCSSRLPIDADQTYSRRGEIRRYRGYPDGYPLPRQRMQQHDPSAVRVYR